METTLAKIDKLPEFPRLNGPLGELVDGITHDIPYEHKALAVLTYMGFALSGRTELADPYQHIQPRFYACFIGPKGSGKSAAQKEVNKALNGLGGVKIERSINSGPALVSALDAHRRLLYSPDEITGAFQKAKHGHMFDDLKTLYEDNKIENHVKAKRTAVVDCHFAIVGTCTRKSFEHMWLGTGGGSDGLQSRFVLTLSEQLMPRTKTGNNELAVGLAVCSLENMLNAVSSTIELPETVGTFTRGLTGDGSHLDAKYTRVIDMGRRFALIVAACNGLTQIDDETMKLAAAFINYQVAAYEPLMPEDSYSWVQAVEQRIIAYFKKHQPATERDCRNNLRPDKSPAGLGTFKSAFNNLVTTEVLLLTGEENRVGKPKFELDSTYIES